MEVIALGSQGKSGGSILAQIQGVRVSIHKAYFQGSFGGFHKGLHEGHHRGL